MIAIWIGIFLFISIVVLVFTLALCKSAALADREFERAWIADKKIWSNTPDWIESDKELFISPDTKPATRFEHSGAHSYR
jgi:hypothetical protein